MRPETTITEIQFVSVKPQDGLVGFASFALDQKYFVGSVAVRTRLNGVGYRLVYPAKKGGEKSFQTFHPIDPNTGRGDGPSGSGAHLPGCVVARGTG